MTVRTALMAATLLAAAIGAAPMLAVAPASPAGAQAVPGHSLDLASVPNLRDVGGYMTANGTVVRTGLVYRSDQLNPVSPDDLAALADLGLATVFDLRTVDERTARPDQLPPGVRDVWLNVLADEAQSAPAQLLRLMANPTQANAALGGGQVETMFAAAYRDFVSLPSAQAAYGQLFAALGQEDTLPALFHCTTGKDRTGWAAAALLLLLGVPEDVVMEDFLQSNEYLLPAHQEQIDAFVAAGGDPTIPPAILGVKAEYLVAALDEMQQQYGTIERYFAEGLGIDAAGQHALRALFLAEE
jgi:protein-tyrosine phosphatase